MKTMYHSLRLLACIAPLVLLSACSQPATQQITEVREPGAVKRGAPPKSTTQERLGLTPGGGMHGGDTQTAANEDPLGGITFHHDMPEGWEAVPATDMRQINLRMTANPEAECYFTLLPGGGGGLEDNLNRWRRQMGLEALSADAIAALPKKAIFGQPGTFILIDGTFEGMGNIPAKPDYRLYGLMLHHTDEQSGRSQGFFLKMTGPRDLLEDQEANFDLIASSLHAVAPGDEHSHDHGPDDGHDHGAPQDEAHGPGDGHDHGADTSGQAASGMTPAADGGYTWTVPAGWENKPPAMMRNANLTITGQPDVECYLSELSGPAGGLEMNINRWRQQMGQDPLTPEQIAALPKHPLMGGEATYVIIDGTFGGMGGTVQKDNFRMYALALVNDTVSHFVKMTGPRDVLTAEEANFLAFAASLRAGAAPAAEPAAEATAPAAPMPQESAAVDAAAANPHGAPDPTPAGGFNPSNIQWTAPEGWSQGPEKMMRVVTLVSGNVECYVASLPGDAGGATANINRWAAQMGQAPLDEAAIAALPKITLLAQEAPLAEFTGDFSDMGAAAKSGYKMLATLTSAGGSTVFIKMTGPSDEVDAQKENFIAFCASLH